MNDNWSWWAGSSEEYYHTNCATREEAIAALEGEGGWICEAQQKPLRVADLLLLDDLLVDADEDIERGEDDDDVILRATPAQEEDLRARIKVACDEWQAAHGLVFKTRMFTSQRKTEFISENE